MKIGGPIARLFQAYILSELRYSNQIDPTLSYTDVLYICMIGGNPRCTASWIADTLGIARSAVTVRLNRLEEKGILVRRKSPDDGRVQFLDISDKYKQDMDEMYSDFGGIEESLRGRFSEDEVAAFEKIIDHIIDTVDRM